MLLIMLAKDFYDFEFLSKNYFPCYIAISVKDTQIK